MTDHATQTHNGFLGLPVWARVVAFIGVPSAISIFLIYVIMETVVGDLATTRRIVEANAQLLQVHTEVTLGNARSLEENTVLLQRYLRMICLNTAKTDADRSNCVSER